MDHEETKHLGLVHKDKKELIWEITKSVKGTKTYNNQPAELRFLKDKAELIRTPRA